MTNILVERLSTISCSQMYQRHPGISVQMQQDQEWCTNMGDKIRTSLRTYVQCWSFSLGEPVICRFPSGFTIKLES
jgi:hypothetical protein